MTRSSSLVLAVATALAVSSGCAVAPPPSPSASPTVSVSPGPSQTATAEPSPVEPGASLLVAWEDRNGEASLLVVREGGTVERHPLPEIPRDQLAAGFHGPLVFLAGSPAQPVLWIGTGDPWAPRWSSRALLPAEAQETPLRWPCVGPNPIDRLAVQSDDARIFVVADDGGLRPLPAGPLLLRPEGCAWIDEEHLVVAVDTAHPASHLGFAQLTADGSRGSLLDGPGGEHPTASTVSLARVVHSDGAHYRLVVGPLPAAGEVRAPTIELAAPLEWTYLRPVLSADGERLATLESDPFGRPVRLLLYDLRGEPTVLIEIDVGGAIRAGPAWVADPS